MFSYQDILDHNKGTLFTLASLAMFYLIVYGIPLSGDRVVLVRSALLIAFSASVIFIVARADPIGVEPAGIKVGSYRTLLWGVACFAVNFAVIGALYVLFKDFIATANSKFYFQEIRPRSFPLRVLISASAALSEETVYRLVLFRYILSFDKAPLLLRQVAALMISSLLFGFGHFHAGLERCLLSSVSGLVFAAFFLWRKNIWVVVFGHFLGDLLAFSVGR